MKILRNDDIQDSVSLVVNKDELWYLLQAMSELCDGLGIPDSEFKTRIGFERADGQPIIKKLGEAHRALRSTAGMSKGSLRS
jgi:hypothetical protein